jgi:hypothetical protein
VKSVTHYAAVEATLIRFGLLVRTLACLRAAAAAGDREEEVANCSSVCEICIYTSSTPG